MTPTTVPDVLDAAADYLEAHGKCRGRYSRGERRCVLGALAEVLGANMSPYLIDPVPSPALFNATRAAVRRSIPQGVSYWSDGVATKTAVAKLREIAQELR